MMFEWGMTEGGLLVPCISVASEYRPIVFCDLRTGWEAMVRASAERNRMCKEQEAYLASDQYRRIDRYKLKERNKWKKRAREIAKQFAGMGFSAEHAWNVGALSTR
jgi:hypothetical protein